MFQKDTLQPDIIQTEQGRRNSRVNHCMSLLGADDVNPTSCDSVMNNTAEGEREREKGDAQTHQALIKERKEGSRILRT